MSTISLPPAPYTLSLLLSITLLILSERQALYVGSALFKTTASLSFFLGGYSALTYYSTNATPNIDEGEEVRNRYRYMAALVFGLGFSVVGDVLLIPSRKAYFRVRGRGEDGAIIVPVVGSKDGKTDEEKAKTTKNSPGNCFKLGMLFFALAHISYILSFLSIGLTTANTTISTISLPTFLPTLLLGLLLTHTLNLLSLSPSSSPTLIPASLQTSIPTDMIPLVRAYAVIIMVMVATSASTGLESGGYTQRVVSAVMFAVSDVFVAVDTFGKVREEEDGGKGNVGLGGGWRARAVGWVAYFGAQLGLAGCVLVW